MSLDTFGKLLVPAQPWLLRMASSHSEMTDFLWSFQRRHPGSAVRFLRGKAMTTVQGLYDEFTAALQFPYYFGYNGGAFDECLTDLSWLPAKAYVLTIVDSADFLVCEDLLASEPKQLPLFLNALERICLEWSKPIAKGESWDRPAVAFHVSFHCIADDVRRLAPKIADLPCISVPPVGARLTRRETS